MKKLNPIVMLVDDCEDDRLLIQRAFEKVGFAKAVHSLADGAEAIEYMMGEGDYSDRNKFPYPTFIITDLKMPRQDGFAVLDFLKQNPEWAVIPTIVLSGSTDLDDIRTAYMLGASSYHVKPGNHSELMQLVSVLAAYWLACEVPAVDASGRQMRTDSSGKLGERFPHLPRTSKKPVRPTENR